MLPDERGYFGEFGGRFVPETLVPALDQLNRAYEAIKTDAQFWAEFSSLCRNYVGRPTPHKNLERLVEAFEILNQEREDLFLVLAGKNDKNYQRIKRLVDSKNLTSQVIFTDFVSEGQLRWLYENCQAYIFPSLSEGFGLPGLEAMIHGAPVVSSNATCLPEIYGDAAHYFNPLDVEDMAEKINEVISDNTLRQRLVKTGHAQAARYSWQKTARQTLEIYKSLL